MNKMNKIINATLAGLLGIVFIGYGCNSVNPDTEEKVSQESSTSTQAKEILKEFSTNKADADAKYLEKVITVSGKVANAVETEDGYNIEIEGENGLETISCAFAKSTLENGTLPNEGEAVEIKGKVTGYTEEDMMGLKTINMVQCLIN